MNKISFGKPLPLLLLSLLASSLTVPTHASAGAFTKSPYTYAIVGALLTSAIGMRLKKAYSHLQKAKLSRDPVKLGLATEEFEKWHILAITSGLLTAGGTGLAIYLNRENHTPQEPLAITSASATPAPQAQPEGLDINQVFETPNPVISSAAEKNPACLPTATPSPRVIEETSPLLPRPAPAPAAVHSIKKLPPINNRHGGRRASRTTPRQTPALRSRSMTTPQTNTPAPVQTSVSLLPTVGHAEDPPVTLITAEPSEPVDDFAPEIKQPISSPSTVSSPTQSEGPLLDGDGTVEPGHPSFDDIVTGKQDISSLPMATIVLSDDGSPGEPTFVKDPACGSFKISRYASIIARQLMDNGKASLEHLHELPDALRWMATDASVVGLLQYANAGKTHFLFKTRNGYALYNRNGEPENAELELKDLLNNTARGIGCCILLQGIFKGPAACAS